VSPKLLDLYSRELAGISMFREDMRSALAGWRALLEERTRMEKQNEADTVKGMLQALEHTLEALDRASAAATQLIEAQKAASRCLRRRSSTTPNNLRRSPNSANTCGQ
jgi:hypothetical protein